MAATTRLPSDLAPVSSQLALNRVIGSGASFPFSFSGSGGTSFVGVSTGFAKINQSIHAILSTRKGERVMRPTFGSNLQRLIFEMNDPATFDLLKYEVAKTLATWEKRITITTVTAVSSFNIPQTTLQSIPGITQQTLIDLQDPNTIGIVIQYVVLRYNVPGSYVYPFALGGDPLSSNLDFRFTGYGE